MNRRVYIVAGEASGDLHAANLVRALRGLSPDLEFRGMGGDRMAAEGVEIVRHIRDTNFMGFLEVARNIGTIMGLFRQIKADIDAWRPATCILVDYPGFNLRMAKFLHNRGVRVLYYISPTVWAWHKSRVEQVRRYVTRLFAILPFEQAFYAAEGLEIDYVGHPLLDEIKLAATQVTTLRADVGLDERPVVALLPGSRPQEIKLKLPIMLGALRGRDDVQPVMACAPNASPARFESIMAKAGVRPVMVSGRTHEVLQIAEAALVTSGTATLETAIIGTPQVVCYKGNWVSYQIAKRLVNVKYISLVNLILDREAVVELLQYDLTEERLRAELDLLLQPDTQARIQRDYAELRTLLGSSGASERCARLMLPYIEA